MGAQLLEAISALCLVLQGERGTSVIAQECCFLSEAVVKLWGVQSAGAVTDRAAVVCGSV